MKGLIFHEWFMIKNSLKVFAMIAVLTVLSGLLYMGVSIPSKPAPHNLYIEGNAGDGILNCIKEKKINVTGNRDSSNVRAVFSKTGKQVKVDIYLTGNSKQDSIDTKNLLVDALGDYKDIYIKDKIKSMGLEQEVFKPVIINYVNKEENEKTESLTNIFPLLMFVFVALALFTLFNNGLIEERKSKSIYTILMASVSPITKLFTILFFRVLAGAILLSFIPLIYISTYLHNPLLALAINTLAIFNIVLIYYTALIISMVVNSTSIMAFIITMLWGFLLPGWFVNKSPVIMYSPLSNGISVTKAALYGDVSSMHLCLSLLYCVAYFLLLTAAGYKLLKSEYILRSKVI